MRTSTKKYIHLGREEKTYFFHFSLSRIRSFIKKYNFILPYSKAVSDFLYATTYEYYAKIGELCKKMDFVIKKLFMRSSQSHWTFIYDRFCLVLSMTDRKLSLLIRHGLYMSENFTDARVLSVKNK
jgi:hypothetical protein